MVTPLATLQSAAKGPWSTECEERSRRSSVGSLSPSYSPAQKAEDGGRREGPHNAAQYWRSYDASVPTAALAPDAPAPAIYWRHSGGAGFAQRQGMTTIICCSSAKTLSALIRERGRTDAFLITLHHPATRPVSQGSPRLILPAFTRQQIHRNGGIK